MPDLPASPLPEAPVIVQKAYDHSLWLLQKTERFPRSHRFTVGDRLSTAALDLTETLGAAVFESKPLPLLHRARQRINQLRFLLRLAKDLRLIQAASYGHAAEQLEELGRMTGGWIRSTAAGAK